MNCSTKNSKINIQINSTDLQKIKSLFEKNTIKFEYDPIKILDDALKRDNIEIVEALLIDGHDSQSCSSVTDEQTKSSNNKNISLHMSNPTPYDSYFNFFDRHNESMQTEFLIKSAIIHNATNVVKYLLNLKKGETENNYEFDIDMENGILLELACAKNRFNMTKILCEYAADLTKNDYSAFRLILKNENSDIAKLLVINGIDHSIALKMAAEYGCYGLLEVYLRDYNDYWYENGYHCDDDKFREQIFDEETLNRAFVLSCKQSDTNIVNLFLNYELPNEAGTDKTNSQIDIHYRDDKALIKAVNHNNYDIVKLLLEKGANPMARNGKVLEHISWDYDDGIVRLLESHCNQSQV